MPLRIPANEVLDSLGCNSIISKSFPVTDLKIECITVVNWVSRKAKNPFDKDNIHFKVKENIYFLVCSEGKKTQDK